MNHTKKFLFASIIAVVLPVCYGFGLAFLFWHTLTAGQQALLPSVFKPEFYFILFGPLVLVVYIYINAVYKLYIKPLSRLKEEATLIQTANPSHRIAIYGSRLVSEIAGLINDASDQFQQLDANVNEKISEARKQVEDEKNILAAFISELSEGVIICRDDGRILLFNKQARNFLSATNKTPTDAPRGFLGLGRSIFGIIDKNIVAHALDTVHARLTVPDENPVATFVVVGTDNKQLRVEAVPVLNATKTVTGYIFIMVDITSQLHADKQVYVLLQNLTKKLRASSGGIRAAVETIIQFPDMQNEQREMFNGIVHKEALNLSETIEQTQEEYASYINSKWPLAHIRTDDIAASFSRKVFEKTGVQVTIPQSPATDLWVQADSYSFIFTLFFIADRLNKEMRVDALTITSGIEDKFVYFDMTWAGKPVQIETVKQWTDMILTLDKDSIPLTMKEVVGHHDAEIIPFANHMNRLSKNKTQSGIRIFIPAATLPVKASIDQKPYGITPEQHPVFYDFDLFNRDDISPELENTRLRNLVYTVFDTETTGLNPSGGDEIISIGALRIVNLKLLYEDIYEQLINPCRSLPEHSIKIHGILPAMLDDQPVIEDVLPVFSQFTEDTVLLAHNAAFDMAMLKAKEKTTGIIFKNPVLDTLLLSAVVHPEQDRHDIESMTRRLGVTVVGRHTAVGDALTTGELFLKLVPLLEDMGIQTLKQALEASKKTFYARLDY